MSIVLTEPAKGRKGIYYYIIDNGKLVHISKFASEIKRRDNNFEYLIDPNSLLDKEVLEFGIYEDYCLYLEKYKSSSIKRRTIGKWLSCKDLERYKLDVKDDKLNKLLELWRNSYVEKMKEISSFIRKYQIDVVLPNFLSYHLYSLCGFPLTSLISNTEEAIKATEELMRTVLTIWVAIRILEVTEQESYVRELNFTRTSSLNSVSFKQQNYVLWYNPTLPFYGKLDLALTSLSSELKVGFLVGESNLPNLVTLSIDGKIKINNIGKKESELVFSALRNKSS
ncbi:MULTISPECIES: hypothetical protein [Acidianus]|uniref:Uncharacterized protein n=1 Tax=Candidatus Acidianus copahuensis TaxID=1160895 RepID=A0A031LVV2_9CREN|nr:MULTISPECIES: hypothetical protein [Acidianus]EZQ11273.1 hypothetical protein CM19_01750 [Candidatus Acidianus copahuensis]NON63278.1 hypothetical protein [Acidianus sp. RZ1]